jgi:hypothetical protein
MACPGWNVTMVMVATHIFSPVKGFCLWLYFSVSSYLWLTIPAGQVSSYFAGKTS